MEGMTHSTQPLTPDLARAARALTQVSVDTLATESGLEASAIRGFEQGVAALPPGAEAALRAALEAFGADFIPEDEVQGYGVRQRYNTAKVRRFENWENEGGPAREDDV